MKKTEIKLKTSKSSPAVKGSAVSSKPAKTILTPMKELTQKKDSKPALSSAAPGKALPAKNIAPVRSRSRRSSLKSEQLKPITPQIKDRLAMSSPAKVARATKPAKDPKDPKSKHDKKPQKLVQLVPTHRPSNIPVMPANKEKMLMRFGKPAKRVLYKVDFLLKASPTILYHFITTPSCLVRWFCDAVDITGEFYTFSWRGNTEVAELIDDYEDERLRFRWLDGEDDEEFFEFRITTADITDETILDIYDFAWADEVEEQKQLWRTQVDRLKKETGDQ